MANKFAIVGISGLAVCVVCLGAAGAIGGKALRDSGFNVDGLNTPHCDFDPSGKQDTRKIAWDGGDKVGIALPADVHYQPGQGDQISITGDSAVLPHIRVVDGTIKLDCHSRLFGERPSITLPGRAFRSFGLAGSGSLKLDNIEQPDLQISLAGSGEIEASGKTDNLDVNMAGSGHARMGALAADHVKIKMAGSNDVEIAPKDDLNVRLAGSGKVLLRTEPHQIESRIAGSGQIIHAAELDKTQ